jgi:hypothetical protein
LLILEPQFRTVLRELGVGRQNGGEGGGERLTLNQRQYGHGKRAIAPHRLVEFKF